MKTLEKEYKEFLKRWKIRGNKTTFYTCPHCLKKIETLQPAIDNCGSKGYWDSVKVCPLCKGLNFIGVWPSGKTKVNKL